MAEHVGLETIKCLREEVNWEDEMDRRNFLLRLYPLIENSKGQLSNLWSVFRPEEIKRLISDSAKVIFISRKGERVKEYLRFIEFVIRTGYRTGDLELDEALQRVRIYNSNRYFEVTCWQAYEIYAKFSGNYFDEETRPENFYVACRYASHDVLKKFLELGMDPNSRWRETGDSPLHLVAPSIRHDNDGARTIELLLRNGANPNAANLRGSTPLHKLCEYMFRRIAMVERFFVVCDEVGQEVHIDARDEEGQTPLHLALKYDLRPEVVRLLLRRGADPNARDARGTTALHLVALQRYLATTFFEICDEMQLTVRVNARDNLGNTPLHLTTRWAKKDVFKTLLRRGSDPNLANEAGRTPLHAICQRDYEDELVPILFEICDEMQLTVQVNARDNEGNTPLQLAVAKLLPNTVDVLLNRGADITNCIFSTSNDRELQIDSSLTDKMIIASGALTVAELLEARGYRVSRSDALKIVNYFVKYGLFEKSSSDLEKSLRDDQKFASKAKRVMIVPSLSLYDLIHLGPKEEEKLLTYRDYFVFAHSDKLRMIPTRHSNNCLFYLCEKLSRGFFRRWALDPFYELIHRRLPILCCEMVLEELNNQDLCNICLAAAGQAQASS